MFHNYLSLVIRLHGYKQSFSLLNTFYLPHRHFILKFNTNYRQPMTPPSLNIGKYIDNKPAYPHEKNGFQQISQLFQFMFLLPGEGINSPTLHNPNGS